MSKIALEGNASGTGTFTIASPNSNSNYTLTLPSSTGTVVVTGGAQTIEFAAGSAASPSITFTGDTNTGIFSPGADTIAFSEGGAESMRIDSSGNVGIGTNSPTQRLDVVAANSQIHFGAATTGGGYLMSTANGQFRISGGAVYDGSNWIAKSTTASIIGDDATGDIKFLSNTGLTAGNSFTPTERMRIDSSGNVGIGITPSYPLSVSRAVNGGVAILDLDNVDDGNYGGLRVHLGKTDREARLEATYGSSFFTFYTNGSERARITSDGEVCINTTGIGSTKLRVYQNGNSNDNSYSGIDIIKGSNNTTTAQVFQRFFTDAGNAGNGSITANGVSGATFTAYSDRRLKENIQDLPPQLDNICRLKPSEFDYIGYPEGQGHQIGFIAQDMQEVYPDVVAADGEGMLQIGGWSKTEARLVKAIQELKAITDAQATRIEALEAEVAALKGQ